MHQGAMARSAATATLRLAVAAAAANPIGRQQSRVDNAPTAAATGVIRSACFIVSRLGYDDFRTAASAFVTRVRRSSGDPCMHVSTHDRISLSMSEAAV